MQLFNSDGSPTVTQGVDKVKHKIDDKPENKLKESAWLWVGEEVGDVKVMFASGNIDVIPDFSIRMSVKVIKVYDTGTTIDKSKIRLYK